MVISATIVALAALAPAVAAHQRRGDLQVSKNCSSYTGEAGSYCTITSSSINAIKAGSRVYYLQAADWGSMTLDSDIVITLSFVTGEGAVTLCGGSGVFRWFEASVDVAPTGGNNFEWDGSYRFSRHC